MSVKHALLALLVDGPRHGYQLKAEFESATGEGWPLNIGQVYSTVQRLARDGLVVEDTTSANDEEGRRPWRLTNDGLRAVRDWLDAPTDVPGVSRDDISMKLLVAMATRAIAPLVLVQNLRVAAMADLQELTARKIQLDHTNIAALLHLDRTILLTESQVRWLDLAEERLLDAGERHESVPHGRLSEPTNATER